MVRFFTATLILLADIFALGQTGQKSALVNGVFSHEELGFRYTPPAGMFDETDSASESVRSRAAALHSTAVFDILLSMSAEAEDTSPDWYSVGIETFPRSRLAGMDDFAAQAKMNVLAAGARASQIGTPRRVTFSGQSFVVTDFEQKEPPLNKRAQIYTTIRMDKLLVFAFAGNSEDKVRSAAATMATFQFGHPQKTFLGFDRNEYPGDQNLIALHQTFAFAGYWLNNPPGATSNTWAGKRSLLDKAGFGFLVLFNGRAYKGLQNLQHASELGKSDARHAIQAATREGFPPHTIIFLDQEEGGRLLPEQKAYLFAWIDGIVQAGFDAGVYCSGIAAKEANGASVVTADDIRQNAGSRKIAYWVTNDACPPSPGCAKRTPTPPGSGVPFAEVWQFAQSPKRKDVAAACPGYNSDGNCYVGAPAQSIHLDLDAATSADPSHGKSHSD